MPDGAQLPSGPRPRKAPVGYSPEIGEAICEEIATRLIGIDRLCAIHPEFPNAKTVNEWLRMHPEFAEGYAIAKQRQAELCVYTGLEIALDDRFDTEVVQHRDGETHERMNFEWVGRCKLASDYLMKLAGKLDARKWGDKLDIDARGNVPRYEDVIDQLR